MPHTHILLPHKEVMTEENAGAIAAITAQNVRLSSPEFSFTVFGQTLNGRVMPGISYQPLVPHMNWLSGQNIGLARAYVHFLKTASSPDLTEVHGRAQVARYIARKRPDLPVILYLHNDPRTMKGAGSVTDRLWLMRHLAGIICVSDYIRACFLDGLPTAAHDDEKLCTVRNGTEHSVQTPTQKQNRILIVGRMVPEKGILPACRAAASVLVNQPDWHLDVVGGRHFKTEPVTSYEKQIEDALSGVGEQTKFWGFQPVSIVRELQNKAAISIVPSLWDEPCGLTGLEALAAGSALLTTDRGGIPEYATGRAEIVTSSGTELSNPAAEQIFIQNLADCLSKLITRKAHREQLQQTARTKFPFTAENMVVKANKTRQHLLSRFTNSVH